MCHELNEGFCECGMEVILDSAELLIKSGYMDKIIMDIMGE